MEDIKIDTLLNSVSAIKELTDKDVPIKTGVALTKAVREIQEYIDVYEKKNKALYEKYGELDEETQQIAITDDNIEVFKEEYTTLKDEELDIDIQRINIDDFGDISVKTSTLLLLEWMLEV